MYRLGKYKETDKMSDLICENYQMLLVMSRFGIALGFGEQSIGEVCRNNHVDAPTFLTVVNMLTDDDRREITDASISIVSLVSYLRNAHIYFLDFRLPAIRNKLFEAIVSGSSDVIVAIIRYYDEYAAEVRKHMQYEENTVFPYVEALMNGKTDARNYRIEIFSRQHEQIDAKLSELKDIIIKYYPANSTNELNSVLFDIFTCSLDLASHNDVENYLFVPAIKAIEKTVYAGE
ncbi:MAG: hemerythrin domain-containing protein [Tannerella sp.]|jgi:regulator of cell morphogenesis and NO signaling|nr:hemerythrin domain-containing protein [Tannerella sp.]